MCSIKENKKIKAVLFDLDGVILDTESQYTIFWGGECRRYHPESPNLEYKIKGETLTQILNNYFNVKDEQEQIIKRLNEFEHNMSYNYIKGFEAFIHDLRNNGIKTAVVTSSNKDKMQHVYSVCSGFKDLFDIIMTSEDFSESKPSPDCYLKSMKKLGLEPENCVVFEDSINGLKSGKAAKMKVVGLSTTNSVDTIQELSDYIISDYNNFSYNKMCDAL
jgi:beta-phosphoglucomutase